MSNAVSGVRQYYLGINGDQTGPYLEQDLMNQIRQGRVPGDALVWFEGLPDWQPIRTIEFLQQAFDEAAGETVPEITTNQAPDPFANESTQGDELSQDADALSAPASAVDPFPENNSEPMDEAAAAAADFASGRPLQPVFSEKEGSFGKPSNVGSKLAIVFLGVALVGGISGAYFLVSAMGIDPSKFFSASSSTETAKAPPPRFGRRGGTPGAPAQNSREVRYSEAVSDILLRPSESISELRKLINEKKDDKVAKDATEKLIEYYSQNQRPTEAGNLLMGLGRYLEASQYFLTEPADYNLAENSIYEAYKVSDETNKRDLLLQDIRIILGNLNNVPLAIERIRLLDKEFPGTRHPFNYYLKPTESKITDMFNRIRSRYRILLDAFVKSEFPELNLVEEPSIEIKKSSGKYVIEANYEGDVLLSQDRLKGIRIIMWYVGGRWSVVDTNLTDVRREFARKTKARLMSDRPTGDNLLLILESDFRDMYPKVALHESVPSTGVPPEPR